MIRDLAKSVAFALLGSEFAVGVRRARIRRAGVTTILNLHRVSRPDRSAYVPLDPRLFDDLVGYLKQRFSLITFAEIGEDRSRPKLILSFDDGYKDFADVAAPILKRHGVRANQNIIPACVESGLAPLNVVAQDFVGQAPAELLDRLEVPGFTIDRRPGLGMRFSAFLKNRPHDQQDELAKILLPQFFDWQEFRPTPMMSRDEVRQIAADHEVGGHSFAHSSMEYESDAYLSDDVRRCRSYFDGMLGRPMIIYAFPNGSYRPGQVELVRHEGIEHVLLVGERFDSSPQVHCRFTFDATSQAEARFKAHGGLAPVRP